MSYESVEPFVNYWGTKLNTQFTTSTGRRPAEQIVDMMNHSGDPRIGIWFQQPSGAEGWKGVQSGIESQEADFTGIANLNKANLGDYASPYALMKYDEVLFIQAEAIQRGWIAGDAAACYQNAIRASINYWKEVDTTGLNITDKVIENFLANVPYDGTLESIINQKYVALFWVGYEGVGRLSPHGVSGVDDRQRVRSTTTSCRRVCLSDQYDGDQQGELQCGRRTPEDLLRRRRRHEDPRLVE